VDSTRCWLLTALLVSSSLPRGNAQDTVDVPIVFVARELPAEPPADDRAEPVVRGTRGRLIVRHPDGRETVLAGANAVDDAARTLIDIADPDVSFDGTRIVFAAWIDDHGLAARVDARGGGAGIEDGGALSAGAWRIFAVRADGSELRQVTRSNRDLDIAPFGELAERFASYDDLDPCWLPDGRICFVSTRYPGLAPGGRLRTTNLYVVSSDGSGLRRITTERFGADTPAVEPSRGTIVYSRWWLTPGETVPPTGGDTPERPPVYYGPVEPETNFSSIVLRGIPDSEFPGVNLWSLAEIRPDGAELSMYSGFGLNRSLTMAYRPAFLPGGEVLSMFITDSPLLGAAGDHGLRITQRGPTLPRAIGGPQTFRGGAGIPDPVTGVPQGPPAVTFYYASAAALDNHRLLVSGYTPRGGSLCGTCDRDVWVESLDGRPRRRLFGDPDRAELDAVPLVARGRPPVIVDRAPALAGDGIPTGVDAARTTGGTFTFLCENIFSNAPVDVPIASAPPMGRDLTIEFYMHPQRPGAGALPDPVLIARREIPDDGRVEIELPAGVPLFEVLRRPDGRIALGRDGQPFHVGGMNFGVAGETARCVGCHAGHSQMELPDDATLTNIAPSAVVSASSSRRPGRVPAAGENTATLPAVLVDRKTTPSVSEWVAHRTSDDNADLSPTVALHWQAPIVASELVVYGVRAVSPFEPIVRDLWIRAFTVRRLLAGAVVDERRVESPVSEDGTRVALDATSAIDTLEIHVDRDDAFGGLGDARAPALAEIEVIGRAASDSAATAWFRRGDADCDGELRLTDAVAILLGLFGGGQPFCCEAASDVNGDQRVDLTDAVWLLAYSFRGGVPPAEPFAGCGRSTLTPFACDQEFCP